MTIRSHRSEHSCHLDGINRNIHDSVYNTGLYVLTRKGKRYNFSCSVEVDRLVVIGVVNGIVAVTVAGVLTGVRNKSTNKDSNRSVNRSSHKSRNRSSSSCGNKSSNNCSIVG